VYGTVAKIEVKAENREKIRAVMQDQMASRPIPGFVTSYVLHENDSDTGYLFVVFEDRESYDRNADDPAMDANYREYRALMESDPEWHDGVVETYN
jgi:quinol monooxygenase YgiN